VLFKLEVACLSECGTFIPRRTSNSIPPERNQHYSARNEPQIQVQIACASQHIMKVSWKGSVAPSTETAGISMALRRILSPVVEQALSTTPPLGPFYLNFEIGETGKCSRASFYFFGSVCFLSLASASVASSERTIVARPIL
jgi:hypothetical protein